MSDQRDKLNQVIVVMSLTSLLFMPPGLMAGLFGMNVPLPMQEFLTEEDKNPLTANYW